MAEAYEIVGHSYDVVIAGAGDKQMAQRTSAAVGRSGDVILHTQSEISRDQIVRASAPADIKPGGGGTYQITVDIECVQKSRYVGVEIRFNALQCTFFDIE